MYTKLCPLPACFSAFAISYMHAHTSAPTHTATFMCIYKLKKKCLLVYLSLRIDLCRGDHKETYGVVQPYRSSRKSNLWLLEFEILSSFQDNVLFLILR